MTMPDSPGLRRIAAAVLSATVGVCALPVATAGATIRHDQRARCEMHAVVVRGEISGPAASGATSFSANVWSVRVFEFHPGLDSALCGGSAVNSTTTTGTTTASGSTTCPVPPGNSTVTTTGVARGVAINTASTTRVMLNGAASTVSSLPRGDHFLAVFIVPACAGDGSNSGIPAVFVAAWPPHSGQPGLPAFLGRGDHHGWWDRDRWGHHHGGEHHLRG